MNDLPGPRTTAGPSRRDADGPADFVDEREPEARILVGLARIGAAIRSRSWESAGPRGLNPTQARILAVLLRAGREGLGLTALAEQLGVSQPSTSDSVAALEKKGLVAKKAQPQDGRRLNVTLTRKGRGAARAVAEWPEDLVATIRQLSDEEQATFLRSLVTVVRGLAASGQLGPTRTCATCRYFDVGPRPDGDLPYFCRFANAPFGDLNLRLDCLDHEGVEAVGP